MDSEISFKQFNRSDLKIDPELLRKFVAINHQEEIESDYPLPVPDLEWIQNYYLAHPFPFSEQSYILVEYESRSIAYGSISANSKINSEMASIFIYVIPEYRGKKLVWLIADKLSGLIPTRIKRLNMAIRSDSYAPNYDYRQNLINYFQSKFGQVTFKARRSTSDLDQFNIKDIIKKAEILKKQAIKKGYSFVLIIDRPNFDTLSFSQTEYVRFLESISNDMPREDASFEDINITNEMFQYIYDSLGPLSRTRWQYIAIHDKSKEPAGLTEEIINKTSPVVVYQGDTGVFYKYRGNRLGLTLKYLMLAEILTNELTKTAKYWTTFNAKSNKYMIDINDELNYKEDAVWFQFEIGKEKFNSLVKEKVTKSIEVYNSFQ